MSLTPSSNLYLTSLSERFRREWPKPTPEHERIIGFLVETHRRYCDEGLADLHFNNELATGSEYVYQQRVGELLLAEALWKDGFKPSSAEEGPDFFAERRRHSSILRCISRTSSFSQTETLAHY